MLRLPRLPAAMTLSRRAVLRLLSTQLPNKLDFSNTEAAYAHLSQRDLARALFVFQMCSVDSIVDNSLELMKLSEKMLPGPLFRWIMENTIYGHFVPGETHEDVARSFERYRDAGVRYFPAASVEDELNEEEEYTYSEDVEAALDENAAMIADSIQLADFLGGEKDKQNSKVAIKLSAIIKPRLLTLISSRLIENGGIPLMKASELHARMEEAADERDCLPQYTKAVNRLDSLIKNVNERGISIFIDAEHSYMQPAICSLVLYMQSKYNRRNRLTVFNTQQTYIKGGEDSHRRNLEIARLSQFNYATKVVRGAYMVFERAHAKRRRRRDPIHDTYENTTALYHRVVNDMMERAAAGEGAVMAASQNENTVNFVANRMESLSIAKDSGRVTFAQQLGMADHITFPLGREGYLVYKYSPYGSIASTLAYLCRRAQENRTVLKGLRQENKLLAAEWKRRYGNT